MNDISKTVVSLIVIIITTVFGYFGVSMTDGFEEELILLITTIVNTASGLAAWYFRVTATREMTSPLKKAGDFL